MFVVRRSPCPRAPLKVGTLAFFEGWVVGGNAKKLAIQNFVSFTSWKPPATLVNKVPFIIIIMVLVYNLLGKGYCIQGDLWAGKWPIQFREAIFSSPPYPILFPGLRAQN